MRSVVILLLLTVGGCHNLNSAEFDGMLSRSFRPTTGGATPGRATNAAATSNPTFLDDAALARLYRNTTRRATSDNGDSFIIESHADGTQSLTAGTFTDSGTWVVRDGAVCETWETLLDGSSMCWRFALVGGQTYRAYDAAGRPDTLQTITPR